VSAHSPRPPVACSSVNHFISDVVDLRDAVAQGSAWNTGRAVGAPVGEHPGEASLTRVEKAEGPRNVTERDTSLVEVGRRSLLTQRFSKTVLGLGIVAVLGAVPVQKLLPSSGVEAVVNARVVTLSAQIDGVVQAGPSLLEVGTSFGRGDVLLNITNERADRSHADDLAREIQRLTDERPGIVERLADARMRLVDLTEQMRIFTEARTLQLEARQDELRAELAAAQARNEEANTTLERFATLAGKGWTSRAQLNQAQRDGSIAEKSQAAAQKRLEAVGVELAAAQRGVFVGVGSGDRPRYMQRTDQLEQQISNLAGTLAERDQRLVRLNEQLAAERSRYRLVAAADMAAPAKGRIWETPVSPGQQVHRGQEVLRVLYCDRPLITALVSEPVYNQLQVGSAARFLPRGDQQELVGRVIRLSRVSPSNLAIQPSAAPRESYHVAVSVPKLADGEGCLVGRTGRLRFDNSPSEIAPVAEGQHTSIT
jgi:multidrug resistance efflux pump